MSPNPIWVIRLGFRYSLGLLRLLQLARYPLRNGRLNRIKVIGVYPAPAAVSRFAPRICPEVGSWSSCAILRTNPISSFEYALRHFEPIWRIGELVLTDKERKTNCTSKMAILGLALLRRTHAH